MDNRYNRHNRRKYNLKVQSFLLQNIANNYLKAASLTMLSKRYTISVIRKSMRLLLWKQTKTIYIFLLVTILQTEFVTLLSLSNNKLHIIYGRNIQSSCLNSIGRRKSFGPMDILLVA